VSILCPFQGKKYETIEKDEILCFQSLIAQLLDIKELRKIGGHESVLPSHPIYIINNQHL